jgi:hypothetical protein
MMRTVDTNLALLYFENGALLPSLDGFRPRAVYTLQWFDPSTGDWLSPIAVRSDGDGVLVLPGFPSGDNPSARDWAAKITTGDQRLRSQ